MLKDESIYVVGHKNPDTDSICSAISCAYLKNAVTGSGRYVAARAGQINEETEFVLRYWHREPPHYLPNVGIQVSDMDIDDAEGAPDDITVRIAWEYMKESRTSTLPVMDQEGKLEGLLTVGDIANYCIDPYSKDFMSGARTKYYDIAETLNGLVIVGNEHAFFSHGNVLVGAAEPERLASLVSPDDMVITSDRADAQEAAIRAGASCVVVTLSESVPDHIRAMAEETSCVLICTSFDTFTVARLINQSIPVTSLMKTEGLVLFRADEYADDVRTVMGKYRHHNFPVIDHTGKFLGMISRQSVLNARHKRVILVDHTEKSQAVDNLDQAEILEIIDHHRIGTVETLQPVYFRGEPVGCTATILTSMFHESGVAIPKDIAGLMCSAILSDTLMFRSPTCTPRDEQACRELAGIAGIEIESYAREMFRAGSNLKGKTPDEILHQDYKKFIFGDTVFGVGQISSMDETELMEIADLLRPQLEAECGKGGTQMVFFMLTNILSEDTHLLCCGEGCGELVEEAYGIRPENGICLLPGVVSRKKQLIPAFMQAIRNE